MVGTVRMHVVCWGYIFSWGFVGIMFHSIKWTNIALFPSTKFGDRTRTQPRCQLLCACQTNSRLCHLEHRLGRHNWLNEELPNQKVLIEINQTTEVRYQKYPNEQEEMMPLQVVRKCPQFLFTPLSTPSQESLPFHRTTSSAWCCFIGASSGDETLQRFTQYSWKGSSFPFSYPSTWLSTTFVPEKAMLPTHCKKPKVLLRIQRLIELSSIKFRIIQCLGPKVFEHCLRLLILLINYLKRPVLGISTLV